MLTLAEPVAVVCDMNDACQEPVAYIDVKGFVYCAGHGMTRKNYCRCRKLKPKEIKRLNAGLPLEKR